jgi:hypothetical protein
LETIRNCKNCGARLEGEYCSACGQAANTEIPSFWQLTVEFLDDLYSLDSRIWRTVIRLLFRPGELTRDFLAGRRARFLPPLRMYLVMSFLYFLVASALSDSVPVEPVDTSTDVDAACVFDDLPGFLDTPSWRERLDRICRRIAADGGRSFSDALSDNFPLMMFLVLPLVAVFMKLLYAGTNRYYIEHLLFLLHFHAFFFALSTVTRLAAGLAELVPLLALPTQLLDTVAFLYIPVYLYLAMRKLYDQPRWVTVGKYVALAAGYGVSLLLMFMVVLAFTALTL